MRRRRSDAWCSSGFAGTWLIAAAAGLVWSSSPAAAQQVQLTGLQDKGFGTVNPSSSYNTNNSVCAYIGTVTRNYTVTATGNGSGGAFLVASGSATFGYTVEWSGTGGNVSGTALTAGTTSGTFNSSATTAQCTSGPATSASLIIRLPQAQLGSAQAGSYSGVLTLTIAPQ